MFRCVLLYRTTLSRTVEHLELGVNYLLYQLICFGREHRAFGILFEDFNAGFVDEESVIKNLKLVVEHAKRVALSHLVAFAFPTQSLVIVRVHVRSDVDRLKVLKIRLNLK